MNLLESTTYNWYQRGWAQALWTTRQSANMVISSANMVISSVVDHGIIDVTKETSEKRSIPQEDADVSMLYDPNTDLLGLGIQMVDFFQQSGNFDMALHHSEELIEDIMNDQRPIPEIQQMCFLARKWQRCLMDQKLLWTIHMANKGYDDRPRQSLSSF